MGRIYTAQFSGQAETAQCDLIEIVAGAGKPIAIHEVGFSQGTEIADAQEEMLLIQFKSGQTTTGSGGNTMSSIPLNINSSASGATLKDTNTTKASTGTIVTKYSWYWNVRIPFQMIWTPETRPLITQSTRATFELATTPTDSITYGGYIVYEELA